MSLTIILWFRLGYVRVNMLLLFVLVFIEKFQRVRKAFGETDISLDDVVVRS